jgi:hypothetical protein
MGLDTKTGWPTARRWYCNFDFDSGLTRRVEIVSGRAVSLYWSVGGQTALEHGDGGFTTLTRVCGFIAVDNISMPACH